MKFEIEMDDSEGLAIEAMAREVGVSSEIYLKAIINMFARHLGLALFNAHPYGATKDQIINALAHEFRILNK